MNSAISEMYFPRSDIYSNENLIARDVIRGKVTRKVSKRTIFYIISIGLSSIVLVGLVVYINVHLNNLKSLAERNRSLESSKDLNKVLENETLPDMKPRLSETHNKTSDGHTTSGVDLKTKSICKPIPNDVTQLYRKSLQKCMEYQSKYVYPCRESATPDEGMVRMNHCNWKPEALIISGENAYLGEFPHMALLGFETEDEYEIKWKCGGTIVSEKFVLTAAHCTSAASYTIASRKTTKTISKSKKEVKYVRIGILLRNETVTPTNMYTVKRIYQHPNYKSPYQYHDIALLEVNKVMKLHRFALPACLYGSHINDSFVIATGWGTTKIKEYSIPDILQKVTLEKYTDGYCYRRYQQLLDQHSVRHLPRGYDEHLQVCYGDRYSSRDTCKGDSGGPTQIKHPQVKCMYLITSIISIGKWCGEPTTPGLYTRVSPYLDWIESIVWPD